MGLQGLSLDDRERLTASGLTAFFSIAAGSNLNEQEQVDLLGLKGNCWEIQVHC